MVKIVDTTPKRKLKILWALYRNQREQTTKKIEYNNATKAKATRKWVKETKEDVVEAGIKQQRSGDSVDKTE